MGDLSKRLSRHEFACQDGCGFQTVDIELVSVLEDAADYFHLNSIGRDDVERVAILINSGCRCEKHDAAVKIAAGLTPIKGEPGEHSRGWAADVRFQYVYKDGGRKAISGHTVANYFERKYPEEYGIGRYASRTHIDMRPERARWGKSA